MKSFSSYQPAVSWHVKQVENKSSMDIPTYNSSFWMEVRKAWWILTNRTEISELGENLTFYLFLQWFFSSITVTGHRELEQLIRNENKKFKSVDGSSCDGQVLQVLTPAIILLRWDLDCFLSKYRRAVSFSPVTT